jgi:transposase
MARGMRDFGGEPYWRMILTRWRRSSLTVREFCRAESISEPSFYAWRRKLEQVEQKRPTFLPVRVVAQEADEPAPSGIEIVLANGRCLRVAAGFDPHTLVQVVDLLEARRSSC